MTNFDNAATTFPKPEAVPAAVMRAFTELGGNPSRGGHPLSMKAAAAVYSVRRKAAGFFGASPENTVFTSSCTQALNTAIKGAAGKGEIVISAFEHNSVARPVQVVTGGRLRAARPGRSDREAIEGFRELIGSRTGAVVCTLASNVTGRIFPFREIGKLCADAGICFIADGAQLCGVLPVSLSDGINILCTAGHKGLYGPSGTGLLISDGKFPIAPLLEGGTGSASLSLIQPRALPDALEAGTLNTPGILGLGAGIDFVEAMGTRRIYAHESRLCAEFIEGLAATHRAVIYREEGVSYAPIVAFNLRSGGGLLPSEEVSTRLGNDGFCLRAGFHCSALAHSYLGTSGGIVRFSPSVFNTSAEVSALLSSIEKILSSPKPRGE